MSRKNSWRSLVCPESVLVRLLFQQFQICLAIVIHKENVLAVFAALRDMMCKPDRCCSGQSRLNAEIGTRAAGVKKNQVTVAML